MDKKAEWSLVGAAWFLALSVGGFGYLAWRRLGPAAPAASTAPAADAWGLKADGTARCPVTGEILRVVSSTPQVDYLGHVYYFSLATDSQGLDARTRFLMDPDSFLKAAPAP